MNALILESTYEAYPNKVIIEYSNIDYIMSSDNGSKIHTKSGNVIEVKSDHKTLMGILKKLAG